MPSFTDIPDNVFQDQSKMSILSITNNRIDNIRYEDFSGMSELSSLDISNNLIKKIPADTFKVLLGSTSYKNIIPQ